MIQAAHKYYITIIFFFFLSPLFVGVKSLFIFKWQLALIDEVLIKIHFGVEIFNFCKPC